ncbi:MAG: gamma carbonic anhydrase family protein [Hyphomicrobiaceae bacterium]|nr:gamma carbonic anhydrase family protein [Hyphomicrobiaceae bacterium]
MALYTLDNLRVTTPDSDQYWVADNATVLGNIVLEENSSIWFNAVLRGDNETITVGRGSNVQDGSVLHTDPGYPLTIGENCTVGHMAMLHGCTIGNGSLVGIGAIILNGAVIGEESLVGGNALVAEGKVIPPRSLVLGSPGKVVRQLTDDDIAMIQRGVKNYQARWKQYKSGLKPQVG